MKVDNTKLMGEGEGNIEMMAKIVACQPLKRAATPMQKYCHNKINQNYPCFFEVHLNIKTFFLILHPISRTSSDQ